MRKEELEEIYKTLDECCYLEYGKIIPKEVFADLLKMEIKDNWAFLGPFLDIKEYLEEQGFLSTTRNLEFGALRIYSAFEISEKSNMIFKNVLKRMNRLEKCLSNTKCLNFAKKEYVSHLHEHNKISTALYSLTSALKDL